MGIGSVRLCSLFLVCLTGFSGLAHAQGDGQAMNNDVAEGRAMVQAARDEIIRTELSLSDDEGAVFWPIYEDYSAKKAEVMDRYTDFIADYIQHYDRGDISTDYADELIKSFFVIKREILDIQESYVPKFRKILPAVKVAQFYQLENKINAEIDAQLAVSVPLIE